MTPIQRVSIDRSGRWKAYTSAAAAFFAVAADTNAQVTYTDVDPDSVLFNGVFDIDFDNDGLVDVSIEQHPDTIFGLGAYYVEDVTATGELITVASKPGKLAPGYLITASGPAWNVQTNAICARYNVAFGYGSGAWLGQTGFLGCRFTNSMGEKHYAWVQLSVDVQAASATIQGYAYETTPETPIQAGSTASLVSVQGSTLPNMSLFPNPAKDQTTVKIGEELSGQVSVQLLDGIGRVLQQSEMNTVTGTRQLTLDMSSLPAGSYFISVRNGDKVLHRKVSKVN